MFSNSYFRCLTGVVLILAAGCIQASDPLTGTISGRVQDPTGAPLDGVKVTLSDGSGRPVATAMTPSTGTYVFEWVRAGKYELKAERIGFHQAIPATVDLAAQQKAVVILILAPLRAPAAGLSQTHEGPTAGTAVGYYQSSSLKADEFAGSVDPGGYSAPAIADTTNRLLQGVATLREDSAIRFDSKPSQVTDAAHPPSVSETELKNAVEKNPLSAEANHNLGQMYLAAGKPERAIPYFERAAQIEPSERNILDWGSELLLHRTIEPAVEVFTSGVGRYPKSPQMWIGLGIALHLRGNYDEAVQSLVQATDLNPADYRPYIFLARAMSTSQKETVAVTERLKRFATLYPHDASAVYYYALSLWKESPGADSQERLEEVETLLKKASVLDPKFPDAHLQLGVLYASQQKYPDAIEQYRQAIELDSGLAEAHYKLGEALARAGRSEQAEREFEIYERLHHRSAATK